MLLNRKIILFLHYDIRYELGASLIHGNLSDYEQFGIGSRVVCRESDILCIPI